MGGISMKKFLLLNSPIFADSTKEDEQYLVPIGLGYIATYLEKAEIQVEIVDCVKERLGVVDINEVIEKKLPAYIGINIFTQNYELVKSIVENIKIQCECFVGGQVVKSIYDDILLWDVKNKLNIIIGEGEFIIPNLVTKKHIQIPFKQKDNKLVYKVDSESPFFPKDISNIVLNRDYLKDEIIINHYGEEEAAIVTSRGCMYDCAFCGGARSLNQDSTIRIRSEQSVIDEINDIVHRYPNIKSIRILDDLFLRNSNSISMANRIFKEFPNLNWRGMIHVLSLKGKTDIIAELKQSRCRELFMGIESGSEKIRKKINKLGDIRDIVDVAKSILENGIDLKGYFIYGFPNETIEDFKATYELACELKEVSRGTHSTFRTSVFQFRPYHGTQLYKEIVAEKGSIPACRTNDYISQFDGRTQFNFSSGNYSLVEDQVLDEYIIKTQKITEDKS